LLFVGGVMNLVWVVALTLVVASEKLAPAGRLVGRAAGVLLIAWALAKLTGF
jgi:predicted metal-binding membrane protein